MEQPSNKVSIMRQICVDPLISVPAIEFPNRPC